MKRFLVALGMIAACMSAGAVPPTASGPPATSGPSATSGSPSVSGFPGDMGRPFDGLPFPPGPLPPRPPQRPIPKAPPLDLALEAARAIVEACKGFHVGISIIDSSGTPKLYYIPDGTDGDHAYTGFRKAYTALTFKMPTSKVGELAKTDPDVVAKIKADPNTLSWAGGLVLTAGDQIIGAIGVSGAEPSAKDEECGLVGIEKIKGRLK
jgi:uncharacterized protein GlcG (DUF336 family)